MALCTSWSVLLEVSHIVAFLWRPGRVVAICCEHHGLSASSAATEVCPMQALARGVPVCAEAAVEVPERVVVVEVWVDIVGRRGRER